MYSLKVDLRSGFTGDMVIVRVDGAEAYRKAGVRTRMQLGLADTFTVETDQATVALEVELPDRGLIASHPVSPQETPNIGIEIAHGKAEFTTPKEESKHFGYV